MKTARVAYGGAIHAGFAPAAGAAGDDGAAKVRLADGRVLARKQRRTSHRTAAWITMRRWIHDTWISAGRSKRFSRDPAAGSGGRHSLPGTKIDDAVRLPSTKEKMS